MQFPAESLPEDFLKLYASLETALQCLLVGLGSICLSAAATGNYTPGYPTSTPHQEVGPLPQQGYPTKPAASEPYQTQSQAYHESYQTQPQAYHEEFTRAPPQVNPPQLANEQQTFAAATNMILWLQVVVECSTSTDIRRSRRHRLSMCSALLTTLTRLRGAAAGAGDAHSLLMLSVRLVWSFSVHVDRSLFVCCAQLGCPLLLPLTVKDHQQPSRGHCRGAALNDCSQMVLKQCSRIAVGIQHRKVPGILIFLLVMAEATAVDLQNINNITL